MKLDILKTIPNDIKKFFKAETEESLLVHSMVFSEFLVKKNKEPNLLFDEFLENEVNGRNSNYVSISRPANWLISKDGIMLVSLKYQHIEYALVSLVVEEIETGKLFKLGTEHIVSSDNIVYQIH